MRSMIFIAPFARLERMILGRGACGGHWWSEGVDGLIAVVSVPPSRSCGDGAQGVSASVGRECRPRRPTRLGGPPGGLRW